MDLDEKPKDVQEQAETIPHLPAGDALAEAAASEHALSSWSAIRLYWRAFLWCVFMCVGAMLVGYDLQVTGGLLSVPAFRRDFGFESRGQYIISASWQSAFNATSAIGSMFGGLSVGFVIERFGTRKTILLCNVISIGAILIQFFTPAHNNGMLVAGKLVNGLSLGMYISVASTYCAELAPMALRGFTTASVNLWFALGQLLSNASIRGSGARLDKYAYRIPFATQWIFPVILLAGLPFAPESPWWLVRQNRLEEARRIIEHVGGGHANSQLLLRQIQETIELEDYYSSTSKFADMFKGPNLRRTIIAAMVFAVQHGSGINFVVAFSSYFFELAGFSDNKSHDFGLAVSSVGILGNLCTFYTLNRFGRRTLFNASLWSCTIVLMIIGFLSISTNESTRLVIVSFIIVYMFCYQCGIGPVAYVIYAEVPSARLRSKTVGLGVVTNQVFTLVFNIVVPYLVNPDEANLGGYVGFVFGGLTIIACVWVWFAIPETKGRTVDEIDIMFEEKIPARKFASHRMYDNDKRM